MRDAFIARLREMGYRKVEAEEMLDIFANEVTNQLYLTGEAKLPKLGKLVLKETPARPGRNPATGEALTIPARQVVRFRPSVVLSRELEEGTTRCPF